MAYQFITSHNFSFVPEEGFSFTRFLFNEVEHLRQQGGEEVLTFYWKNLESQLFEARFSVILFNKNSFSPLRATFGGVEFSETLSEEYLITFLKSAIEALPKIDSLEITLCPANYLSENKVQILESCLKNLHFKEKYIDQNYFIKVSERPFYQVLISKRYKQLLKKSERLGFGFQACQNPNLKEIHTFIARSRERKNRPMTMTLEALEKCFQLFPESFYVFSLKNNESLLAVAVCIQINENSLYTFYLADDEKYLGFSPLIALLSGIYRFCQAKGFRVLDLGIATEKGKLNEGLAFFKAHLGAEKSLKKTYIIEFSKNILKK
jgi:hypothetical protein